jgi:release factor glutamine methyltransferase
MNVKNTTLRQWKKSFKQELLHIYPKLEIEAIFSLLLEDLGISPIRKLTQQDDSLSKIENDKFIYVLEALKTEKPIQQILGYTYFDDLKFEVNEHVLIPRQETEELVYWILKKAVRKEYIVDACSGSGCLSIALKQHLKDSSIIGLELSEQALQVARKNSQQLNLSVEFLHQDVLEPWIIKEPVQVVVSNPPYIPNYDKKRMHNNVLLFEPEMALFVENEDPLLFYREIAKEAKKHFNDFGELFFEIFEDLGEETCTLLSELGYSAIELKKDLNGKDRMIYAQWKN